METREKLAEIFTEFCNNPDRTHKEAIDAIEQLFKPEWVSVETEPPIGGEYNVVWDLKDGRPPVTTTMHWDGIQKVWRDVIGVPDAFRDDVLFWCELPNPPKV